ncbi:MAG TPA: hypothetical protein VNT51_12360 [Miltoncostaeaceae bacterium]|nr:hypothetical protein [Miltoncostaeaceae bacterium]
MRYRTLLLTGLATGAAVAVPASGALGAVAAIQDDRLVSAPIETIDARLDTLKQTRARVARVDVFWSEVAPTRPARPTDPADPSYVWTRVDAKIAGLKARGIRPIVSVYSTPSWSSGGRVASDTQYNPNAPRAGDYGRFMAAIARRYSGRYPAPAYSTGAATLPEVRHWEVWNEPNLRSFFRRGSSSSVAAYLQLLREAYPQIKRANPRATVIAGVAGPRSTSGEGSIGARQWLRAIARAPLSVKFDAYSQHIYPSAAPVSRTRAFPSWNSIDEILLTLDERRLREIRAARGAARTRLQRAPRMRLFITEAGYTTSRTRFRNVRVTERQQVNYMRQIFRLPQVRNPRVPVIVWFNMQDNADWPAGLLRANGTRKPSWAAFRALAPQGRLTADLRP